MEVQVPRGWMRLAKLNPTRPASRGDHPIFPHPPRCRACGPDTTARTVHRMRAATRRTPEVSESVATRRGGQGAAAPVTLMESASAFRQRARRVPRPATCAATWVGNSPSRRRCANSCSHRPASTARGGLAVDRDIDVSAGTEAPVGLSRAGILASEVAPVSDTAEGATCNYRRRLRESRSATSEYPSPTRPQWASPLSSERESMSLLAHTSRSLARRAVALLA